MGRGERDETPSSGTSAVSLARALRTLKRRGSNLLVVGLVSEEEQGRVCRRMLGDDTIGSRRRLLVLTDANREGVLDRARRVQRPPPETASYLTYAAATRSSGTADADGKKKSGAGDGERMFPGNRHVEGERLADLAEAIEAEIDAIEAESGDLAPAELRVCLDSATPLLDRYDRATVERFLDRVTTRITAAQGMGHVHLPVSRDWEAVADLGGLFDAVVELRVERGCAQQRWHLQERNLTSDWFDI